MTQTEFWAFIESARGSGLENDQLRHHMKTMLELHDNSNLVDFTNIYHAFIDQLYSWNIWNAISLINGGMSDDSFFYFRDFLVSRGQKHFDRVLNDPESLLDDELDPEFQEWPYSEVHFRSAGSDVYEERNNVDFPWTHKWADLKGDSIDYDNDDEVRKTYPRIWQHLRNLQQPNENAA